MTESMVDRVARALVRSQGADAFSAARAAIAAMREPTKGMLEALVLSTVIIDDDGATDAWQAAINAALSGR